MKNKFRLIAFFFLAIYISVFSVILLSVPASAVDQYNGKVYKCVSTVYTANAGGTTTFPNGITYTVNSSDTVYTGFSVATAARGDYLVKYRTASGTATDAQIGDVIYLSEDIRTLPVTGGSMKVILQCFEAVPIWQSNDSSPFTSIYSTLSHYIFADDFTNVPFGDMWITCASIIGCLLICGLPFLVVWWLLRRI